MPRKRPAPKTVPDTPIAPVPSVPRRNASPGVVASRPERASAVTYQSRIEVIEAYQYNGALREAPDFIDRNWAGYDTTPILRVPNPHHPDNDVICRMGDYVVRQSVTLAPGLQPEERLEVWPKADFERLFMPKRKPDPNALNPVKVPPADVLPLIRNMPDLPVEELFKDDDGITYKPNPLGPQWVENEAEDTGAA